MTFHFNRNITPRRLFIDEMACSQSIKDSISDKVYCSDLIKIDWGNTQNISIYWKEGIFTAVPINLISHAIIKQLTTLNYFYKEVEIIN